MAFRDTRLPIGISFNSSGGSQWDTDINVNDAGYEFRNANQSVRLGAWVISYHARLQSVWLLACNFFDNVGQGKAHTWRLRDPFDYVVSSGEGILVQLTSTTWQMYVRRSYGSYTRDKKAYLPVSGTITVTGGGTYSISYTSGVITKSAGADPTGWTGEYDKHCRFDTDKNDSSLLNRSGGALVIGWPTIPIVEVLEAPA